MKDIERRLLAAQRSLMFAEAEAGDFIVLHSELDPRRSIPKFRKCGTILKKNDTMLYIKPDGSDELFSIKRMMQRRHHLICHDFIGTIRRTNLLIS
ncbi:hypothetical protein EhV164_00449 [Emiliania huxleyi virus 164]|nr:hypothetical protein EhV164_00449 [Emiliania huxleyi virus 164]